MTASIRAERYHDISCGHRVAGHEGKCAFLHGHNYRISFVCQALNPATPMHPEQVRIRVAGVDEIGRVLDFSVMKERLCMWLEAHWDHKFLAWDQDP
jgi:6-pyruvoyltetrahydropterin/6-carboxytetrahydropterin synthase